MVWLFIGGGLCLSGLLFYPLLELLIWRWLWLRQLSSSPASAHGQEWSTGLLYLSGISHFASAELLPQQIILLEQAATVIQPDRMLTLAFPYDPQVAQAFRPFDLWRQLGFGETPLLICSLRNFWQAWLASWLPNWYGAPVARCLQQCLGPANSPQRLVVIGNSTGGALLLSAAVYLRQTWPTLPITAILCGGVLGESDGFAEIKAFHQLLGQQDPWPHLATLIFPKRQPNGAWQQAEREGRYQTHALGDMAHFGPNGYYSDKHIDQTSALITALLKAELGSQVDQPVATSYNVANNQSSAPLSSNDLSSFTQA